MVGCSGEQAASTVSTIESEATVCGVGSTVKGIDVSYYQGTIDWNAVKNDGVAYAFIRVSDGEVFADPKFDSYWAGSRAAGIKHGAYQFFRPAQDPIAQADLLLSKIGNKLAADDLPPVVDVEASDGETAATVETKLHAWVDRVTTALGRAPIVYTGQYFWRDSVGGADFTSSPLWHAQYTTASCPTIAEPWHGWTFWQYTSSGTVAGISGDVDLDRYNGDKTSLLAFLGPAGSCGDGTCNAGESSLGCPEDCGGCGTIAAGGGTVDDGDRCFEPGGPLDYLRPVTTAGDAGDLIWTHATEDTSEANFATWHLVLAEAGRYEVEVYTAAAFAQSHRAKYVVEAGGETADVVIDQSSIDGWQSLGTFELVAGGHQSIHLGDNTGEPLANNVQLVFDSVRLTRVDDPTGEPPPSGGCATGGGSLGLVLSALLAGLRRRRR